MSGVISALLAAELAWAAPLGGYRHLTSTAADGQVALNTEALTDFETATIAQTRLAGQLGRRVVVGFELPVLAQARSEQPTIWGGQHVELRLNPVAILDHRRASAPRRALDWDLGVEASVPLGSETQAGFWAVTPLEAVNWRRIMVALRTTRSLGDHACWQTYAAVGTVHSEKRLLVGQATLTASRHTKWGGLVSELDFSNTPLANALSLTGLIRRNFTPQLDGAIGINLPLSNDINSALQLVSQLRFGAAPPSAP